MAAGNDSIARGLAAHVVMPAILFLVLVISVTQYAARLEFRFSWPSKSEHVAELPPFVALYQRVYPYSWIVIGAGVIWSAALLWNPRAGLRSLAVYVGSIGNIAALWILWTLLTFYMLNQSFAFVLE
jgi:hypothetical protein